MKFSKPAALKHRSCCLEAFPLWLKFSFSNMHANLLANRLIMRIIAFAGVR